METVRADGIQEEKQGSWERLIVKREREGATGIKGLRMARLGIE